MRHTVTEVLRAVPLGCAAVAVVLCFVYERPDGARWDILAALLVGAICIGAWALLTRGKRRSAHRHPDPRRCTTCRPSCRATRWTGT